MLNKVGDDEICNNLDKEINILYSSIWIPNENEISGYSFDEEKEKELSRKLLELIMDLIDTLNLINDGPYEIEDMISDHLKSLI